MMFKIFLFPFLFLWQLPQNLLALVVLLFSKDVERLDYRHYCFVLKVKLPQKVGGVSLGNFALISPDCVHDEFTIRHEADGHTVDSMIFGPLYLLVIGLPSVLHLLWYNRKRPAGQSYYDFYTECWANRHAGLK